MRKSLLDTDNSKLRKLLCFDCANRFFAVLFRQIPQNSKNSRNLSSCYKYNFLIININALAFDNNKITTAKGTIYTNKSFADSSIQLINYLSKTLIKRQSSDFPEGMTINFLTDRKADDFYNSLLPLYTESLGEDKIIEHYRSEKPEFIIFNNLHMKDYYLIIYVRITHLISVPL